MGYLLISKKSKVVSAKLAKPLDKSETILPKIANAKKIKDVNSEIKINIIVIYQGLCNCTSTTISRSKAWKDKE